MSLPSDTALPQLLGDLKARMKRHPRGTITLTVMMVDGTPVDYRLTEDDMTEDDWARLMRERPVQNCNVRR